MPEVDLTEDRLFPLGPWTLIYKAVCAPKSWSGDRISEEATMQDPPGTSANRWVITTPKNEGEGVFSTTNPIPCQDCPEDRRHWLLNC